MESGWSPNYATYHQAFDEIVDNLLDTLTSKCFPKLETDSTAISQMKEQLSLNLVAAMRNDFDQIFKQSMAKHNVESTLDAHYVHGEKKELLRKVAVFNSNLVKYEGEDKLAKMREYLQDFRDLKKILRFHPSKSGGN
jgi:hypothetical protein